MATIATAMDELLKKKEELFLRKDEELSAADEKDEGNKSMPSTRATTFLYEGIVLENDQKKAHVVQKKKTQADSTKREDESSSNARQEKSTAKKMKTSEDPLEDAAMTKEGWIWNLYKIRHPGMTDEEIKALEQEGDQVSFFCAEAEWDRWLEQWEIKIAEFLWCIRSLDQYAVTWKVLASNNQSIRFKQYALEKANMYAMLGVRARQEFETLGYGNALNRPAEQTLEDFMIA
ncbi:hypothetical protein EV421DRAFT_1914601 [Armillaria borealis]|uniref:Uncharacterized protein n=1 Tax=Armillaria borealis TaxID=47425 RepID=A0AA39MCA9_9AGAR|nr:hypothetical protein EV421DRAFT_1914601 [Armillaria borealis]